MKIKILYCALATVSVLFIVSMYSNLNQSTKYIFLAKRVQIDKPNKVIVKFVDLREKLEVFVKNQKNPEDVSIYFEYLPTGVSIKINEKSEQVAASLMKVPVVMDIFKAQELGYLDLNKKVTLRNEWLNNEYGNLYQKGSGYELTLLEAVKYVLRESDNTAFFALWGNLKESKIEYKNRSLDYLDVGFNLREDERVEISPESYSSILKCLYFACFNSLDDSNQILSELTESKFNNRLVKHLPKDIKVAHKIGSFSKINQSDCGIVYLPSKNYLLCVMVKGSDEDSSPTIADVSRTVFEYMSQTDQ